MGRFLGWAFGIGCVVAISAVPAAAQVHVSVGVHGGGFGGHVAVGYPPYPAYPVYAPVPVYYPPPVYAAPVYYPPVYYPAYRPVYRAAYRPVYGPAYGPVYGYGGQVVVVQGRHDNGNHNGHYKNGNYGRGPQHGGHRK